MLYAVKGIAQGMTIAQNECHFVEANNENEALSKIHKSIWYNWYANAFKQADYEDMKKPFYYGNPSYRFYNEELIDNA